MSADFFRTVPAPFLWLAWSQSQLSSLMAQPIIPPQPLRYFRHLTISIEAQQQGREAMTKRISRQGPGRPPIGAEAMTGAQREARRKQRIAERLQIARAAAVAAASAVEKAADALQGAAGGSQGGQEAYGVRKAVQSLREAHEAVLAAVARR